MMECTYVHRFANTMYPTRCDYCAIPYAVIAKFETYNEDLR